ncbi:MAG TPA: HypC/HybG/HupF family hydrogenase formation chaperone [Candidatus Nanoarchaeia archaeon]|nr:HypC/HybG/HupF family hydrogenase formation chaperone [Candidatus Nanoarchaeia archaeon]
MCLAIPGKIIEIKNDIALIDYGSEKRQAKIMFLKIQFIIYK